MLGLLCAGSLEVCDGRSDAARNRGGKGRKKERDEISGRRPGRDRQR